MRDTQWPRTDAPCIETARRFESEFKYFWLHVDLDVLDQEILPAVDYPMPDGLDWKQAAEFVHPLFYSPARIGADITIYNPTLDPGMQYAKQIVAWLAGIIENERAGRTDRFLDSDAAAALP